MIELEKERRFLVKPINNIIFVPETRTKIIQMYLEDEKTHSVRIRIINRAKAKFCYKKYISDDTKWEFEFPIPIIDAMKIWDNKGYRTALEKTRYKIAGWEVDKYSDELMIAEFEFSDKNPFPTTFPVWIGEEVTGVYEYSNVAIAKRNGIISST